MKRIIFIGFPASGKGTQGKLLKKYGFSHYSSGDWIRSSTNPKIINYREKLYPQGLLLPDKDLFSLFKKNVPKNEENYILDGVVRTIPQAKYMKKNHLANIVLHFNIKKDIAIMRGINRAKIEGRTDDTPEGLEKRFEEYKLKTDPTLEYLRDNFEF